MDHKKTIEYEMKYFVAHMDTVLIATTIYRH